MLALTNIRKIAGKLKAIHDPARAGCITLHAEAQNTSEQTWPKDFLGNFVRVVRL